MTQPPTDPSAPDDLPDSPAASATNDALPPPTSQPFGSYQPSPPGPPPPPPTSPYAPPASSHYPPAPPQYIPVVAYAPPAPAPLPTGLATTSMVLGIVGLPFALFCGIGVILSIAAFATGMVAVRQSNAGQAGGKGMAIAGIVTGAIGIGALLLMVLFFGISLVGSSS